MIFVTVGTHEQQFNRLIKCVDELKENGWIKEDVVIQSGYSTYKPKNCDSNSLFPYQLMQKYVEEARIVITHGGPSSFIMPLQIGKIPIVVPRQKKYGEHVNDHQMDFCRIVSERQGNILLVEDVENLNDMIQDYDTIISTMKGKIKTNNGKFCADFENIVEKMFEDY